MIVAKENYRRRRGRRAISPGMGRMKVPLARVALALIVLFGVLVGVGSFTFDLRPRGSATSAPTRGLRQLPHHERRSTTRGAKGPHHASATCVDCHLPHEFVPKYIAKAENGYRHSKGVHAAGLPRADPDQAAATRILQENCMRVPRRFRARDRRREHARGAGRGGVRALPPQRGARAAGVGTVSRRWAGFGIRDAEDQGWRNERRATGSGVPPAEGAASATGARGPRRRRGRPGGRLTARRRVLAFALIVVIVAVASALVTALLVSIFKRKQEAKNPYPASSST